MTNFFKSLKHRPSHNNPHNTEPQPPEWAPAPEVSHPDGQFNEASDQEYQDGMSFCLQYPLLPPSLVPSHIIDRIKSDGAKAWGLNAPAASQYRFSGSIENILPDSKGQDVVHVATTGRCRDYCLVSNLPIAVGMYDTFGREGVYFEVVIHEMYPPASFLAIGTCCQPYPVFRLPGWNRQSTGWHLDDLRKFFEDPDGGRDYTDHGRPLPLPFRREDPSQQYIPTGSTVGCGYIFSTGSIFYTFDGLRLPDAFSGAHLPRRERDVFAAIGVSGETKFDVNFGGEPFRWLPGNTWPWRVEGLVGRSILGEEGSGSGMGGDELPAYSR